jgi:predicted dehydrogenase
MSKEIRVGVAGLSHGHVGGLIEAWKSVPGARFVAVSDHTALLEKREGFERKYSNWDEMLDKEAFDVLIVTSNNVESTEIAIAALGKGVPCIVEKAMAATAADADRMLAASKDSGTLLMINWPFAWQASLLDAIRRAKAGEVGELFYLRYRNGHFGPREIGCEAEFVEWLYDESLNGGGAIADFGSYGATLSRVLFGMPESVFCLRGNLTKDYEVPDDHAVILLKYPKAHVYLEATWATRGGDASANPVISGTTGTLAVANDKVILSNQGESNELVPLELAFKNSALYFAHLLETGESPEGLLDPEICADSCRILDAAKRSAASGKSESP